MLHVLGMARHGSAWLNTAQLPSSEFNAEKLKFSPNGIAAFELDSCFRQKHCQLFNYGPPIPDTCWMYLAYTYIHV